MMGSNVNGILVHKKSPPLLEDVFLQYSERVRTKCHAAYRHCLHVIAELVEVGI